jgi:hypothetical protein
MALDHRERGTADGPRRPQNCDAYHDQC